MTKAIVTLTSTLLALAVASCNMVSPTPTARLNADAGADVPIPVNGSVTLNATAEGGVRPFYYRWSLEVQPDGAEVDLGDQATQQSITINALTVEGRYVFRVRITDSTGESSASFVTVNVGGDLPISISGAEPVAVVGEPQSLSVSIDADTTGLDSRSIQWEVMSGEADVSASTSFDTEVTVTSEDTARLRASVTGDFGGEERYGVADVVIAGVRDLTPQVVIENTGAVSGDVVLELFAENAPKTVANFLRYVDENFYNGIVWHRVVDGFVIQGGGYEVADGELIRKEATHPPVVSEANNGKSNVRGTVAMALRGTDANSGDTQFFVNLDDNSANLDSGPPPFTVFARVVDGMDIVDEIAALEVGDGPNGLTDVPVDNVIMSDVHRAVDEIPTDDTNTNGNTNTNGLDDIITIGVRAADPIVVVGDSTELTVRTADSNQFAGASYEWEVVDGAADLPEIHNPSPEITINEAATIHARLTITGFIEGNKRTGVGDVYVVGVADATPRVALENSGAVNGEMIIELATAAAPNTCANFLRYVDAGFYDGIVWHRAVEDFVIQTGAYERVDGQLVEKDGVRPPVPGEAPNNLSNVRATVAMALRGSDPDSGDSQFFINVTDNTSLDDTPFTVFGRVVEGMSLVDEIANLPVRSEGILDDVPVDDVVITSVRRLDE